MFDLSSWSVMTLIVVGSLIFLIVITRVGKRQVKLALLFHLAMFDLVVLYLYHSFSGVALDRLSGESWPLIVAGAVVLFVLPFALYWLWLALVSIILLPIELTRWRTWQAAAQTLVSFARGVNYPYYSDNEGTDELEKRLDGSIMTKGGGPGLVLVRPEHAAALHSGPELTHVAGGDVIFTRRKERVLTMVDLRLHVLVLLNVTGMTKDGISVKFVLLAICRIDPAGAPAQPERLYPYNPDTVFRIVCDQQDVGDKQKQAWYEVVALKGRKVARDVVATYTLDRLLTAEDPNKVPRHEIRAQVRERLIAELAGTGIEVFGAGLGNIQADEASADDKSRQETGTMVVPVAGTIVYINAAEEGPHLATGEKKPVPVNVADQRVASWQVEWQRRATERLAHGEAQATRILQQARAQVLAELIHAVEEGFREMAAAGATGPNDVIALSFINAVEQMLAGQEAPESLGAASTRSTLQTVRRLMLLDR
jgi:hypothetical protein